MKRIQKITLITGSYPPNVCGVGDYTSKLFKHLKETEEFQVEVFYKSDWHIKYYFKYLRELIKSKSDVFHFQYPTEGYEYSILPLILFVSLFRKNTVLTVHELSSRNMFAYVYTQLLVFFSKSVIVSNSLEHRHALRFVFKPVKISIIPIASNIEKSNFAEIDFKEREVDIAYFGHIRPLKGIESFLYTISLFTRKLNVQLIGQRLEKYLTYYEEVNLKANHLNVSMIVDKEENEVADILAKVKIIYLPFPDGISNRRGTLLASMQNGCVVVSKKSNIQEFNNYFEKYCYLVDSNEEAFIIIDKLLKNEIYPKAQDALKYQFSWENVISEHSKIYNNF